jgi:hypothetical protein
MPVGRVQARGLLHAARMAAGPDGIREPVLDQLRRLWAPFRLWGFPILGTNRTSVNSFNDATCFATIPFGYNYPL